MGLVLLVININHNIVRTLKIYKKMNKEIDFNITFFSAAARPDHSCRQCRCRPRPCCGDRWVSYIAQWLECRTGVAGSIPQSASFGTIAQCLCRLPHYCMSPLSAFDLQLNATWLRYTRFIWFAQTKKKFKKYSYPYLPRCSKSGLYTAGALGNRRGLSNNCCLPADNSERGRMSPGIGNKLIFQFQQSNLKVS